MNTSHINNKHKPKMVKKKTLKPPSFKVGEFVHTRSDVGHITRGSGVIATIHPSGWISLKDEIGEGAGNYLARWLERVPKAEWPEWALPHKPKTPKSTITLKHAMATLLDDWDKLLPKKHPIRQFLREYEFEDTDVETVDDIIREMWSEIQRLNKIRTQQHDAMGRIEDDLEELAVYTRDARN